MTQPGQSDYFANHAKARRFPWTLYHRPLERDLARFLADVHGTVLVVGCGLLHELDVAPPGVQFVVADVDARAVEAVLERDDPRIVEGIVVEPEKALEFTHRFDAIYAKEVVEHVLAWPSWLAGLRRSLVPGGHLWLSTPNYGEPWLPALESTVLELVARRDGFTRRDIHPTRFSRRTLERGLVAAGFREVDVRVTPTRLAITAWAIAP
ncbi:MAG: methyltransferase domain-containing protein [Deltaproteobacteria bacterium]